ncbi:MAG: hypothetical protein KIT56_06780 [Gammaproteobacteria bacterium]|nr:hypothetical protein [Gammaproteobacteria bacterium]MCW5583571.1 hypothetical protein [Gammaproteobacteria bacterium]
MLHNEQKNDLTDEELEVLIRQETRNPEFGNILKKFKLPADPLEFTEISIPKNNLAAEPPRNLTQDDVNNAIKNYTNLKNLTPIQQTNINAILDAITRYANSILQRRKQAKQEEAAEIHSQREQAQKRYSARAPVSPLSQEEAKKDVLDARKNCLSSLERALPVVNEITTTFPEVVNYTVGVGATTVENMAAVLQTIPEIVAVSEGVTKSLSDIARSMSMPNSAALGITVGWNYIDAVAGIVCGINLIMDEEDYRQTQNKVKGVLSIIAGVQAFAFSYNPALGAAVGLGAGAFAGPAFAFTALTDLVNASIDFYNASKELTIEGWLDERVKEINYKTERIQNLETELQKLKVSGKDTQALEEKINTLKEQRTTLSNDFLARSRVYCNPQDQSLSAASRKTFVGRKMAHVTPYEGYEISTDALNTPPTRNDEIRDKEIQSKLNENYRQKRADVIMKGLSFTGMTLLAIAPFTGPAAPILYAAGLTITLFVAGSYLYKHREKIHALGKTMVNKAKKAILSKGEKEPKATDELPLVPVTVTAPRSPRH